MNGEYISGRIKENGIIPTIRTSDPLGAVRAAEAICIGGITVLEISMAMPGAIACLEAVVKAHGRNMIVGAGTVTDAHMVRQAAESGAQFIVTPGFRADSVATAHECDVAIFAGALTPTEVQIAAASKPSAVKLFPCNAMGGPPYVRALKGQYPNVDIIASGGVTVDNCSEYFHAGACAIGVGSDIADEKSICGGNQRLFIERSRRFRKAVSEAQARWIYGPVNQ
ncbi:MAG TPA: bifunctional 4-hydroxy-2-oxoglutarate aldolase/2-dehydro-3-deoxy-phosphogluconate aldolase [Bryobacteraceae bacterium]|jgi:2-dehydro-3-deoxyphosphogluconate aldolase/(4S)-4-hydroxy-2-oxoglutarate aldolase|nr:bifunctional 4-hydroxy-2-oxoglutarate aldolase/2-dehydro-3-deoxy-phosphogluconate aldolase [Bryobacteraceae bacterium]